MIARALPHHCRRPRRRAARPRGRVLPGEVDVRVGAGVGGVSMPRDRARRSRLAGSNVVDLTVGRELVSEYNPPESNRLGMIARYLGGGCVSRTHTSTFHAGDYS
jgi:hypothetical protein